MADIKKKLDLSILQKHGLMTAAQLQETRKDETVQRRSGGFEISEVLPGELIGEVDDAFYRVRTRFPLEHVHGLLALGETLDADAGKISFSAADPELGDFDPRSTFFMDTETIGLAGGSGTVAFLIGVGFFEDDAFVLDQCFMRDFDDEEPMLRYLDELLRPCSTIVSYNGKSFDLPLMRTRFVQNRIPFRLEGVPHYDLVHAARRFFKRRLQDCSLGNIEREVLGIHRQGDVPGYLIPEMWFNYLNNRDARPLKKVFYHHSTDILSLVTLTAWLSKNLSAPGGSGFEHAEDQLSVVRLHYRQKQYEETVQAATLFLESSENSDELCRECLEMLAYAGKRLERFDLMQDAWQRILDQFPRHMIARHELAKHHEHRTRDLLLARRLCEEAIAMLDTRTQLGKHYPYQSPELAAFQKRLARIQKKMGGNIIDPSFLDS